MTNKKNGELVKIEGRLAATQALWDYEREQILKTLGITGCINVRSWTTEALVQEVKDCINGEKMLLGQDAQNRGNGSITSRSLRSTTLN